MAGTVMHLVIADRLFDKLPIENKALFFCGNLAPDAIMGRKNYIREMKNHTHFKDGQKPYTFRIKENRENYMVRLMDFYENYVKTQSAEAKDLYLGYLVHILVDELYLSDYYEEFLLRLEKDGISPEDPDFCKAFTGDVDRVDWELVRSYSFSESMPELLFSEDGYEIKDYITAEELSNSKRYIIYKNFEVKHDPEPLMVADMDRNYRFIELCVNMVPKLLKERFGI